MHDLEYVVDATFSEIKRAKTLANYFFQPLANLLKGIATHSFELALSHTSYDWSIFKIDDV